MSDQSIIHIALTYLVVINIVTFFVYGIDKWKAKKSKWRVPEATLLGLAVIGGSIGASIKETNLWHFYEVLIFNLTVRSYENNLNRQRKRNQNLAKGLTFSL